MAKVANPKDQMPNPTSPKDLNPWSPIILNLKGFFQICLGCIYKVYCVVCARTEGCGWSVGEVVGAASAWVGPGWECMQQARELASNGGGVLHPHVILHAEHACQVFRTKFKRSSP
jgi:hypothetical protein